MIDPRIIDEAVAWHLRQRDMAEDGWEAFVAWLEASLAHAVAYDVVASDDVLLAEALASVPAPVTAPALRPALPLFLPRPRMMTHRRWGWVAGAGAIAATLAVVVGPLVTRDSAQLYAVETRPGEHRTLALADGTQVALDGDTRLRLDRANPRVAELERGQVLLHVRHDAADPFTLRSGGVTIQDMGTVFDVTRAGPRLSVAVAEGSVMVQPQAEAVTLTGGRGLMLDEAHARITLGTLAPDEVGGWQVGRLSFTDEPLAGVAAALERRYGTPVALGAGLPDRPFTGMIALSGSAERDIPHLAALIGADWQHKRGQWTLAAGHRAPEDGRTR